MTEKKKKFNFAVVRSVFGDIWIGKTKLPVKDGSVFADYDNAFETAKHFASYDNVEEMELTRDNDEIEVISKDVERFIV